MGKAMKFYARSPAVAILLLLTFGIIWHYHATQYCYTNDDSPSIAKIARSNLQRDSLKETYGGKRRAIVVFASMRTGSSFFGEYFNQHSEIYYLYDPLHGAGWGDAGAQLRRDILWDLLRCNFSRLADIYTNMNNERWKQCRNGVCFPDRSKFLRRNSKLCNLNRPICSEHLDPKQLEKICRQSMLTTVKEIAMASLGELEPILADPSLDLKVIQLIRDPRPVVPSRLKMSRKEPDYSKTSKVAQDVCSHFARNIAYMDRCILGKSVTRSSEVQTPSCGKEIQGLWKRRFMRISHEYVSEEPLKALDLIYNFVGLNYDENVAEWIKKNTAVKSDVENEKDPTKDVYGRSRDSKAVISAWRTQESLEHIDVIQKSCIPVMEQLGYVPVKSEFQLRNISLSLYDTDKHLIV